jgi:pilus assembly protein Flp/PilA
VLKYQRQSTEETLDGSRLGKDPPATDKRRRKGMLKKLMAKMRNEEGQGLVEYALIIVLVSIAAVVTLGVLGTTVSGVFTTITGSL